MRCLFDHALFGLLQPIEPFRPIPLRSGLWSGWYAQEGRQHHHTMVLSFDAGVLSGHGSDELGPFFMIGEYSEERRVALWIKQYVGRHRVFYQGAIRDGALVGRWII